MPMKIGLFVASSGIRYGSYGFLLGGLGLLGLVLGKASYRKYQENNIRKKAEMELEKSDKDDGDGGGGGYEGYYGDYNGGKY